MTTMRGHANSDFIKLETSKKKQPSFDIYHYTNMWFYPQDLFVQEFLIYLVIAFTQY